jgi:hypothetical protein
MMSFKQRLFQGSHCPLCGGKLHKPTWRLDGFFECNVCQGLLIKEVDWLVFAIYFVVFSGVIALLQFVLGFWMTVTTTDLIVPAVAMAAVAFMNAYRYIKP